MRYLRYLILSLLSGIACPLFAVTVVECRDADGNLSFRDTCPPDTAKTGEKRLSTRPAKSASTLDEIAAKNPVTLYAVPNCDACDLVRQRLESRGIPFTEKHVNDGAEVQQELKGKTGSVVVPTVTVGQASVSGYDSAALDAGLEQAGFPAHVTNKTESSTN
ncbi:MAG: glutaredoxin domain-containing protein [Gammaproteobacteria bacterium]